MAFVISVAYFDEEFASSTPMLVAMTREAAALAVTALELRILRVQELNEELDEIRRKYFAENPMPVLSVDSRRKMMKAEREQCEVDPKTKAELDEFVKLNIAHRNASNRLEPDFLEALTEQERSDFKKIHRNATVEMEEVELYA